jgi:hypothetical protein
MESAKTQRRLKIAASWFVTQDQSTASLIQPPSLGVCQGLVVVGVTLKSVCNMRLKMDTHASFANFVSTNN